MFSIYQKRSTVWSKRPESGTNIITDLTDEECERIATSTNLYLRQTQNTIVYLNIYVDDVILVGEYKKFSWWENRLFKKGFVDECNTKLIACWAWLLKILKKIEVTQRDDDWKRDGDVRIPDCRSTETSILADLYPSLRGTQLPDMTPNRQWIGSLMHFAYNVRPDTAFAVHYLARFMLSPTEPFWKVEKYIKRYFQGSTRLGTADLKTMKSPWWHTQMQTEIENGYHGNPLAGTVLWCQMD